ncbi:MAG: 3-deoxy-8-phosphooctulonate synthase [Candidatus Omnitrophica bacterium]|nr:3-deoxy-8-phosphooctulonate synthase [Candidatus Omnitrophota bacterium]MBU4478138.1 3-deoxy-8-phosphooctulonate synthase [Candidatus Omnitrophota bacterium]MCG2704065.1 3-deoxy-8-phosphooctulonate synthase [Candidatus Omnitrophota bacterium]
MDFSKGNYFWHWLADRLQKRTIFLIAGPCVIESEKTCLEHAYALKSLTEALQIPFIFKSSYDKANRTSVSSFRGPGLKKGLAILKKVKKELKIPVTSDVHCAEEAKAAKDILDMLQIPALLSRQTDLLISAAKTNRVINVKKGQFMAPDDMINVIQKIESTGNKKIVLTERGVCFGYHNLVSDMRSIPIMQRFGYPVVFDATHSVQLPSAGNNKSSGEREFVETLALSAAAAGADGLFMEVHFTPKKALCDGPNMINMDTLENLLSKAKKIWEIVHA